MSLSRESQERFGPKKPVFKLQSSCSLKSLSFNIFLMYEKPRGLQSLMALFIHFYVIFPISLIKSLSVKKTIRYFFCCRFLEQAIHMEHFWVTGLIILVFSSLVSSEQKYIMETPHCSTCIWTWDTAAYDQFPGVPVPVCFRYHFSSLH